MDDKISLTQENFRQLYSAFGHYYPEGSVYTSDKPFGIGDYNWQSRRKFLNFISRITNVPIADEKDIYKIKQAQVELSLMEKRSYHEEKTEEATQRLSGSTPDKFLREQQARDLEIQEKALNETIQDKAELKTEVDRAINRQKEIYQEHLKSIALAEKILKDKKVYIKQNDPDLTKDEGAALDRIKDQVDADPASAVTTIKKEIRSRVDPSIPDSAVTLTALNIVANVQTNSTPTIQAEVSDAIAKGTIKLGGKEVQDMAVILSGQSKNLKEMSEAISSSAFGQKFTTAVFKETTVSDTAEPGYTAFSTAYMAPVTRNIVETQAAVLKNPSSNIEIETKSFVERWQAEIAKGSVQGGAFRTVIVRDSFTVFPRGSSATWSQVGGDARLGMSTGLSSPFGVLGDLAKMGVQKVGGKVAGKVATAAATKLGLGATLQAFGSLAPGVGNAIALVATELASRIDLGKLKKYSAYVIGGVAGLIALPFLGLGAALGLGFGSGLISMGFGAGAGSLTLGGIGSGIVGVLGAIAAATLGAIGMPILFLLMGFPIVVALILFIINSGAYVVPPSLQSLENVNPYIEVSKTATPSGPLENTDLPADVSYTITIGAKKDALTNVTVEHKCEAIIEGGTVDCDNPPIQVPGGTIAVGVPFTFTYSTSYDSRFEDSLIVNSVSVTANVKDSGDSQTAAGGASLTVGDPPTGCLKVDGNWPSGFKSNIDSAVATLASKHSTYLSKICSSFSELPLKYNPSGSGNYWGWNHGTYIDFFSLGVKNQEDALYTLAHELGHSLAWGPKSAYIFAAYMTFPGIKSEAPYCFYADTARWNAGESMPEAIALSVIEPRCGSVQQKWPIHYRFLQQYILK